MVSLLLLAEGWFLESDIKADWCVQLPKKINDASFISHSIFSTGWLGKTLKLLMATHWLIPIGARQQWEWDKALEKNKRCSSAVLSRWRWWRISACGCDWETECGQFSHVLPPRAQQWQLRQDTVSLPPPLWAHAAMGKCQSKTSAFCVELCIIYILNIPQAFCLFISIIYWLFFA